MPLDSKAGQSVFNETDIQVVTKSMLDGILFTAAKQYVLNLVKNHPTASDKNKLRISKNVKGTSSYIELINLMNNTLRAFNRVKKEGK